MVHQNVADWYIKASKIQTTCPKRLKYGLKWSPGLPFYVLRRCSSKFYFKSFGQQPYNFGSAWKRYYKIFKAKIVGPLTKNFEKKVYRNIFFNGGLNSALFESSGSSSLELRSTEIWYHHILQCYFSCVTKILGPLTKNFGYKILRNILSRRWSPGTHFKSYWNPLDQ